MGRGKPMFAYDKGDWEICVSGNISTFQKHNPKPKGVYTGVSNHLTPQKKELGQMAETLIL